MDKHPISRLSEPIIPPSESGKRLRVRWGWIAVVIAILFGWWLLDNITAAYSWQDAMDAIGVDPSRQQRYSEMATLGVILIGATIVIRIMISRTKED